MIAVVSASLAALLTTALGGAQFARWMRQRNLGQHIREEGPAHHREKAGTPTMGGVVFLLSWAAAVAVSSIWTPFGVRAGFIVASAFAMGAIGALDDLLKLSRRRSLGLTGWQKIGLTIAVAMALFVAFPGAIEGSLRVPFSSATVAVPQWVLGLIVVIVFLAATNAVNFTDGLDGLATGVVLLVLAGLAALSHGTDFVLLAPLIGSLAGFLLLNGHPASLIMGDVGAYGLGGAVAATALAQGTTLLLPVLAGIPALEVLAVIVQVISLRLCGRRVFRMSPLHHHFEASPGAVPRSHLLPACEWPETKVVVRFWVAQGVFVGLAILAAQAGR